MQVVVDQTQPARGIPSFAKKFVGDEIQVVQNESWNGTGGARLDIEIPGKPEHVQGRIALDRGRRRHGARPSPATSR